MGTTNSINWRLIIGLTLSVASVGMFFWWGVHFQVFGAKFAADLPTFGFVGWIVVSVLCFGYALGGWRPALVWSGGAVAAFVFAFLLGVLRGNYG